MPEEANSYEFGPFLLDPTRRKLLRGETEVPLTPKAFDILSVLVRNGGSVVTKETILRTVWPDTIVDEGNLTFQISALRKALGGSDGVIVTVPGRGYQLAAPVSTVADVEATEVVVEERTTTTVRVAFLGMAAMVIVAAIAALLFLRRPDPVPAAATAIRSLAVLPFKPIVAARRDEALEVGMADTLISRLGYVAELRVSPLTTVRRFGGIQQDPLEAGRQLGVDAVLDGSIHDNGERIRVNARLLRVTDGSQVWSGTFDERGGDLFAIHDSVASQVAAMLAPDLPSSMERRVRRRDTANVEAYRAYAIARMHFTRTNSRDYDLAIAELKRALELDPEYAQAWAFLGNIYARVPIGADRPPKQAFALAGDAARRALALDPDNSDAWCDLAIIDFWHTWNWASAEAHFRRSIALDPSNSEAHLLYAHLLSNLRRTDESRREIGIALRLEPIRPILNALAAQFELQAGNYDEAIRQAQHTLKIDPDVWIAQLALGKAYELKGRFAEAMAAYEKALQGSGSNVEASSMIAHLHALQGNHVQAREVVATLAKTSRERYVPALKIALPYVALGDDDEAFRWLRKGCEERDVTMVFLNVNPRWDRLREDPRFREIEACVGLPAR